MLDDLDLDIADNCIDWFHRLSEVVFGSVPRQIFDPSNVPRAPVSSENTQNPQIVLWRGTGGGLSPPTPQHSLGHPAATGFTHALFVELFLLKNFFILDKLPQRIRCNLVLQDNSRWRNYPPKTKAFQKRENLRTLLGRSVPLSAPH